MPFINQRAANEYDLYAAKMLKILRRKQGVRQTDLAAAAGVTFQQIQKYENAKNRISVGRLIVLCHAIKIQPTDFIEKVEKHAEKSQGLEKLALNDM